MAKTLDFSSVKRPTLQLVMLDEAKTRINVSIPNEGLIEELQRTAPELNEILRKGDADGLREAYELTAKLINCNRSFIKVTPEELREKYHMDIDILLIFFDAYLDFITEITNAKN